MRSISNTRPEKLLNQNDGSYQYNFNVETREVILENEEKRTVFEYESAVIYGEPTRGKCVKAIIRERRDETMEFDLINAHNAFVLGISDNKADKEAYEAYLEELAQIKATVDEDFTRLGL